MAKPTHIFVDANVWLSFYSFTNDDLEQLEILVKLIEKGKLQLYLTEQLCDEFYRNREKKLSETIREWTKNGINKSIPRCMIDFDEADQYRSATAELQSARQALIERVKADAESKDLKADKLFESIKEASPPIEITDSLYLAALKRRNVGNPPGKSGSLGDQISWEALLSNVADGTDLHIVSKDGDFESDLVPGMAHQFLVDEWKNKKHGDLHLHSELRPFLNEKFPSIKLAVDLEKREAIDKLIGSSNFSLTHFYVGQLAPLFEHLSWNDADQLFDAIIENNQIGWIGTDEDVKSFYSRLLSEYGNKLSEDRRATVTSLITPTPAVSVDDDDDDDDEIPF